MNSKKTELQTIRNKRILMSPKINYYYLCNKKNKNCCFKSKLNY